MVTVVELGVLDHHLLPSAQSFNYAFCQCTCTELKLLSTLCAYLQIATLGGDAHIFMLLLTVEEVLDTSWAAVKAVLSILVGCDAFSCGYWYAEGLPPGQLRSSKGDINPYSVQYWCTVGEGRRMSGIVDRVIHQRVALRDNLDVQFRAVVLCIISINPLQAGRRSILCTKRSWHKSRHCPQSP